MIDKMVAENVLKMRNVSQLNVVHLFSIIYAAADALWGNFSQL